MTEEFIYTFIMLALVAISLILKFKRKDGNQDTTGESQPLVPVYNRIYWISVPTTIFISCITFTEKWRPDQEPSVLIQLYVLLISVHYFSLYHSIKRS